jgi:hypothetical protein
MDRRGCFKREVEQNRACYVLDSFHWGSNEKEILRLMVDVKAGSRVDGSRSEEVLMLIGEGSVVVVLTRYRKGCGR